MITCTHSKCTTQSNQCADFDANNRFTERYIQRQLRKGKTEAETQDKEQEKNDGCQKIEANGNNKNTKRNKERSIHIKKERSSYISSFFTKAKEQQQIG